MSANPNWTVEPLRQGTGRPIFFIAEAPTEASS